jgi:hypothetical protein
MPYKFVHRHHDVRKWVKRQARLGFVMLIISLVFGIATIFVADRICYIRELSLDDIMKAQKKKAIARYKNQYGDNWQEKAIKLYKEKYGDDWKEHAKTDYQNIMK